LAKPSESRPVVTPRPLLVVCDASSLAPSDLGTVDALARFALVAKGVGCHVQLDHAPPELRDLLELAGLADVVPCVPPSGVEPRG
jgi:ABC-type transporter Mla MlaB component